MSRFTFCNCPAGFSADPERHAPDCPGRSGAGKPARQDALIAPLSPAHIEDGEEVEVVGYSIEGRDEIGVVRIRRLADRPFPEHMQDPRDWAGPFNVVSEPLMTVAQHQRIVAALSAPPAAVPAELTNVRCMCGDEYPHDSYGAGFIAGSGMCENCDAAIPAKEPPAAGVPIGMACKINGYWEAQLFAGHGCIDRQSLYAHPLPPADVPTGLAHRLLKAYDHGDTGAIEAAIEDIRTMLAAAPTPPASEQQRAVVMPEKQVEYVGDRDHKQWASGANWMLREFLRLNPHLAKGEGV